MRLQDKIAIITGAAGAIGSAIAVRFVEEGATIFLCDLDESKGVELEKKIRLSGGKATFFSMDVTVEEEWKKTISKVVELSGRLDILLIMPE